MRLIGDEVWGALTVWQEARGEPYLGKVAVAEVIQRRANLKFSSDGTIAGTVLRGWQFSGWNTADPNRIAAAKLDDADPVYQECLRAWTAAKMPTEHVVPTAVFYYNPAGATRLPAWAVPEKLVGVIGSHHFFSA